MTAVAASRRRAAGVQERHLAVAVQQRLDVFAGTTTVDQRCIVVVILLHLCVVKVSRLVG